MGNLTPGASYIYERVNNVIYARESGKTERQVIGYMQDSFTENMTLDYELETVWKDIIKKSKTDSVLHDALDRVKILYHLGKDNGQE